LRNLDRSNVSEVLKVVDSVIRGNMDVAPKSASPIVWGLVGCAISVCIRQKYSSSLTRPLLPTIFTKLVSAVDSSVTIGIHIQVD
jgi:hypothetical protein